jgi:hypothetical protein
VKFSQKEVFAKTSPKANGENFTKTAFSEVFAKTSFRKSCFARGIS